MTKTIQLDDLYEIADYYYTGEDQAICPVLLKIKHEDILRMENPNYDDMSESKMYKYLL